MKAIEQRVQDHETFMKRMNKKPPYELVFNQTTATKLGLVDGLGMSSTTIRVYSDKTVREMDGTDRGHM